MFRVLAVGLLLGVLAGSCRAKPSDDAILPPETPFFIQEGVGYGVVNVSFANVLEKPDLAAPSTGLIRKGGIVVVTERRAIPVAGDPNGAVRLWASVEHQAAGEFGGTRPVAGWLPGNSLDVYANLPKAETASRLMKR